MNVHFNRAVMYLKASSPVDQVTGRISMGSIFTDGPWGWFKSMNGMKFTSRRLRAGRTANRRGARLPAYLQRRFSEVYDESIERWDKAGRHAKIKKLPTWPAPF